MVKKPSDSLKNSNLFFIMGLLLFSVTIKAQTSSDSLPAKVTLTQCIQYALDHQPAVQQSLIDEKITNQDIYIGLSGWFPQLEADANAQHYLHTPESYYPNLSDPSGPMQLLKSTIPNSGSLQLSATQTIYSTDLFFAGKTAHSLRKLSKENTETAKENLVVDVSKAFYDVLLSQQQLKVYDEDILRLKKNYLDAYNQYKNGLTDKTDYERAVIALNNARSERKTTEESIKVKFYILKQLMGVTARTSITVVFDSTALNKEIILDTTQNLNYNNRPEYQALQAGLLLQHDKVNYYRWLFLPKISAFGDYNMNFQSDQLSQLFNTNYPNSLIGLKLTLPLFQGANRIYSLHRASLQYDRLNLGLTDYENQMNTEYAQAMASYKSNMDELHTTRENIDIARDIFKTVKFQYDKGVVTYLDVIVAETDLRTAQLNYLNVLFRVLASTLDVKKALGTIQVNGYQK